MFLDLSLIDYIDNGLFMDQGITGLEFFLEQNAIHMEMKSI